MMDIPYSTEWWRWKIGRQIAEYLHQPSVHGQTGILVLLQAYREQQQPTQTHHQDEHEWGMEWRYAMALHAAAGRSEVPWEGESDHHYPLTG